MSVSAGGDITSMIATSDKQSQSSNTSQVESKLTPSSDEEEVHAPLSGNIWKILVNPNQSVNEGDTLLILEAMKMETEVQSTYEGIVDSILISEGDEVEVDQDMVLVT